MPVVAAFACPHTPQLLVRPPTEDRDLVLRVHGALGRVRERLAQARLDALAEAEARFQFRTPSGAPYLFALALYDHHEHRFLDEGLAGLQGWEVESPEPGHAAHSWVQRERSAAEPSDGATAIVGRLILTPSQLMVECDSRKRLDLVKHELATAFGFSLHFRGECAEAPFHRLLIPELDEEESPAQSRVVTPDEEHRLLSAFLDAVYLEWADLPCPALDGQTPRHAAATPETRHKVAALIDEIERNDPGLRRTGKLAYDYNRLRAHVGLEEGA